MPQTVVLSQAKLTTVTIDVDQHRVIANYNLCDANGTTYRTLHFVFWATLPDNPQANWEQLSTEEVTALTRIVQRINQRVQREVS